MSNQPPQSQKPSPGAESAVPAKQSVEVASVRAMLEKSAPNLAYALPRTIRPEYLIRVVITSLQRNPDLLGCHPMSLLGAVFQCAQLGLIPDSTLGEAYLVPFWNSQKNRKEIQFIPGYQGLIKLARMSGEIKRIGANVVHEKDAFVYETGFTETIKHTPTEEGDPGALRAVYAWADLSNGGLQSVVMFRRDVEAIQRRSKTFGKKTSPWTTDPEWMWKKTALRQLCKLLPKSLELQQAIGLDERAEIGLPQDLSVLLPPEMAGDEVPTVNPQVEPEAEAVTATTATLRDVMTAAQQAGWSQTRLADYVKVTYKKNLTTLAPGQECFDVVTYIQQSAVASQV